jgi:hypothetical protein
MAGSCWRLLAAFLLILVAALLRGQDSLVDRVPVPTLSERDPFDGYSGGPYPVVPSPVIPYPVGPYRVVSRNPIAPRPIVFPQIVSAAGIIFSGRVTAIARPRSFTSVSSLKGPESTTVTFKVEHAMRGASVGENLTIHEWSGLWTKGDRYRVGERLLLFLYSPSKLGLTSPVAGAIGRFAIHSDGRIVIAPQHVRILATDPILGGKTIVPFADFVRAVRLSSQEE